METTQPKSTASNPTAPISISDDVLHLGGSKLSSEEVAKALAHHNRRHHSDQPQQAAARTQPGKKHK